MTRKLGTSGSNLLLTEWNPQLPDFIPGFSTPRVLLESEELHVTRITQKWDGKWVYPFLCQWTFRLPPCLVLELSSVQSLSRVWLFATPWIAAHQASLSITKSWSSLRLMSIESAQLLGGWRGGVRCFILSSPRRDIPFIGLCNETVSSCSHRVELLSPSRSVEAGIVTWFLAIAMAGHCWTLFGASVYPWRPWSLERSQLPLKLKGDEMSTHTHRCQGCVIVPWLSGDQRDVCHTKLTLKMHPNIQ